jgi:glycosyltransferase involved in cell wall biosynthesis
MPVSVAILTIEKRDFYKDYANPKPGFGTAPEALLQGFAELPEIEVHLVCCLRQVPVSSPEKLAGNIWYHPLLVPRMGWIRTGYQGCVRAVRRKLKEIKPDLVHGHGTERDCAISAVLSGFPNVLTIHGNMRLIAKINRARLFSFLWVAARLEQYVLPRTGGVICLSRHTKELVADLAPLTWVVPNAVDSRFFEVERKPILPRQIICVANILPAKNQVQLIRALDPLAQEHKFEMVFYGTATPETAYVREFLSLVTQRPWCRFEGFVDRAGLREALGRAAMLVLPTLEENCPMSVLEAMAAGVPVAAADVGGVPDLIADKVDGMLFDPNKTASIRNAVAVLFDQATAGKLAATAKEKALARFHPKKIALRHLEIYREVLAQNAA